MIAKIRFIIQIFFFILAVWIFTGQSGRGYLLDFYKSLHFIPVLTHIAWVIFPSLFIVTFLTFLLPLFFGRIYCAYICPVGFIQDLIFKIRSHLRSYKISPKRLYYISSTLLIMVLFLVLSRSGWTGIFDHFSNFGRIIALGSIKGSFNFTIGIVFIVLIFIVPVFYPRFYCSVLCPSGALYRILYSKSLLCIESSSDCNKCGVCVPKCPTLCITAGAIEKNGCITCFECLNTCPRKGFKIKLKKIFGRKSSKKFKFSVGRRTFLKSIAIFGLGAFLGKTIKALTFISTNKTHVAIPPGGKSVAQFYSSCIGCGICISVCPTDVLKSGNTQNGTIGLMKPYMDYTHSYCSYECNKCQINCPTNAINYLDLERKQVVKIGESKINEETCIPYRFKRICGSCAEHCPSGAIKMVKTNGVLAPVVDPEYCIGCGICENVCPTRKKSIKVTPLSIHTFAYSPRKKGKNKPLIDTSDFPF